MNEYYEFYDYFSIRLLIFGSLTIDNTLHEFVQAAAFAGLQDVTLQLVEKSNKASKRKPNGSA